MTARGRRRQTPDRLDADLARLCDERVETWVRPNEMDELHAVAELAAQAATIDEARRRAWLIQPHLDPRPADRIVERFVKLRRDAAAHEYAQSHRVAYVDVLHAIGSLAPDPAVDLDGWIAKDFDG